MLQFDRLKLATSANYIADLNPSFFLTIPTIKGDSYYKYQQYHPFSLTIIVNPKLNELVIEFTGKVLKDNYPSLISRETIKECFSNIQTLNLCKLDIDSIISDSRVCLCDITKDIACDYPMDAIKKHVKASVVNYDRWLVRKCDNNGLVVYNSVTTPRRFKRFIIYDKCKELKRAENRCFLENLSDPMTLLNRFAGKVRIELNLRSMEQIRNYLHIPNNELQSVLNSISNPILEIWDQAIAETTPIKAKIYNRAEKIALLEQCGYDLQAVEMKLREHTPKTSSIRRKLEPYRLLLQSLKSDEVKPMNIRKLIQ